MAGSDIDTPGNTKVDLVKMLSVFNRIIDHGELQGDGGRLLEGLRASHDLDGYILTLYDSGVRLDLFFHNRYKLDFQSRDQLAAFMKKADAIFKRYCQP